MVSAFCELLKAVRSQTEPNLDEIRQNDIRMLAQQQWELGKTFYSMGNTTSQMGAEKLQQNGTMNNDVHINGWHQFSTKYGI